VKKILAIDGGGIKGLVPAAFLATIEEQIDAPIVQYFDLIAGTSTGGIIALGLGLGFPASEIVRFYEELGPRVFAGNRWLRRMRHLVFSKYDQEPLKEALEAQFGQRLLGESTCRLVIPSLSLATGAVHIYKTAHHPRFELDQKVSAVDVALATAAAPTYFPTHWSSSGIPLVDGGMWANNPTGMAVVEAIGVLKWNPEEILLLSLGCTTEPITIGWARVHALGLTYWAGKVTDIFMRGQSSGSLGTAYTILGHDRVLRISPTVCKGEFSLDGAKDVRGLHALGRESARHELPAIRGLFCNEPVEPFQPYHRVT
jgi:uncharacterized protein